MEDAPVATPSNAPANHSAVSQQPPLSDGADSEDTEHSDPVPSLGRPTVPLICGGDTDDDNEDDQRGVFDYFTPARAVEALGKPKVASDVVRQNDAFFDKVDCDATASSDATRVAKEYEMETRGLGLFDTHLSSGCRMQEDIYNAEMRANNDRQYDERYSVSSADADTDDESDDNLTTVNVHERLIGDVCCVQMPMDPSYDDDDDAMECINQATKMTIQQPLNSYTSQNYGSTGVHSHADTLGVQIRGGADNATGFSRGLTAASGALPANRARIEKSTYSKRPNPPFGDPPHQGRLMQSALELIPKHTSLEDPPIRKTEDATATEIAAAKKKKKKKKHTKGDEAEDTRPQRDINGNPVVATTKKQPSSGKTTDSGSSEPHSRADSGYEFSGQNQMSSSSDSRFSEKRAKKAKRGRKELCTMQAKDIPGNRGLESIETLVEFIDNGQKKQRQQNGQVNGVPALAPATQGGATEQKSSFSAKKPGCGRSERKVSETNSKGQSGGSEGKTSSDMCTGSEGSSVSDSVANMNSVVDTRSAKDASLMSPSHTGSDIYYFTDFGSCNVPQEDEFKEVKKKKKRPKEVATTTQKDPVFHVLCQVEPHRKPHVSAHSVTPPPTSSVCSDDAHVERALSPSSFPVLGRSREGRRNSTGNAPPVDGMQDDSDMESVKSVPIGSELGGRLDGGLSPSNLAKQSYAKIAAAQRPGKDGGALYRAEQTHLTGADGSATVVVKYAKDADREKAVIASVERVEPLGVQNTKPVAGCGPSVAPPPSTCVQLTLSSPVLSSVNTNPHSDNVRTLVMPDDVAVTKKTSTPMDVKSTDQTLVSSQLSTHSVQRNDGSSSLPVSALNVCSRIRSEPSVCSGLRGGNSESKVGLVQPSGSEEEPHTDIPEFIAADVTGQRVYPERVPCHAAVIAPPSDKQDVVVVAKETQSSNKSLPVGTGAVAVVGDASVSIVNTNVESSKMLSPQSNSGLPPAARVSAPASTGSCSKAPAVAPKPGVSSTKRSKTNKSVIFFDKKLNELPQNLGISFGFGLEPDTISVNEITKNSDTQHDGSCNEACVTCERDNPVTEPAQPPTPCDSSLSLVAVTTSLSQPPPGGNVAADIYRAKVLVPVNGVVLPHTASPHQVAQPDLASSSVVRACPEHVHLVSDSPLPTSYAAKPSGRHRASLLYNRANDFNFQRGKFDVEGAVTFLYKEWEKVTRSKRTSRVTFYNKNQYN